MVISTELADKIDRESVGLIVHEKYEEIVTYLQDALQSSVEDENNFKQKADEIQEMVLMLTNSKADRAEIANIQEVMVKSEALLKKFGAQMNMKDRLKDFVSKKDIDALLASKMDRAEFEQQLQAISQNMGNVRRPRKLSSLGPLVSEDLAMRDRYPQGTDTTEKELIEKAYHDAMLNEHRASISALASRAGNELNHSKFGEDGSGTIPVVAVGKGLPEGGRNEFGSYVKNKKTLKASMSLPNATEPGAFRTATEGGRAGGGSEKRVLGGPGGGGSTDGYGRSEYPFVPPNYQLDYGAQSQQTDQLAYLSGPIVGGGFNLRSNHLQSAPPGDSPVADIDIEGKGL